MKHMAILLFAVIISIYASIVTAKNLLLTGRIITGDTLQPEVEAALIQDGRFTFLGTREEANAKTPSGVEHVMLKNGVAYPGFIEGHGHLASFGRALETLDLSNATKFKDVIKQVSEAAELMPNGETIQGRGWHQSKWISLPKDSVDGFPTHHALSIASPNNPVVLQHANGHSMIVNAEAMSRSGIDRQTEAVDGGVIVREKEGNPTGVLHENSMSLVRHLIAWTPESARRAILTAQDAAFRSGITGFHDAGIDSVELQALINLDNEGLLRLRVYGMLNASNESLLDNWINRKPLIPEDDRRLTVRSFKVVMDGALGSRTAWLHSPYTDMTSTSGVRTFDPQSFARIVARSREHGWQINTHAIGDKANTVVLDIIESTLDTSADHRFRIEHAQHLRPADIPRFGELGVIASMQPIHLSSDRLWAINRLGKARITSGAYMWRALLDSNAILNLGTDVPVEAINPLANFYASIARKTLNGIPKLGFEPEQKLTREEALRGFTQANAMANFTELDLGTIEMGKLADVTVLSTNLLTVREEDILTTEVLMTIIGGEIVYRASK